MDFGFSDEQEMLRDAARRFLADNCPTTFVRRMMDHPTAHDTGSWRQIVELGWPGILVPENYGGLGGSFLDMAVVLEEAGRALMPGPFLASSVLGTAALVEGGSDALKAALLPKLAAGESLATLAIAEAPGRFDATGVALEAKKAGAAYSLTGEKFFVPDAHVANAMAVAVRTAPGGENGVTMLWVNLDAPGITVTQLKTVDMTRRLAHVRFDGVKVGADRVLGVENAGWPIAARLIDIAAGALAVELVGTAQKALDLSVDYARTRVQFGKPIGAFQAIKHKCVDMMVAVENARALAYYASWAIDQRAADQHTAVAMAKAYASDMAKNVTSEAIQVHGGIGFTWEHDMHLFHRRALAGEANFGNAPAHRETVARTLLD
jgi:alkylation response protein AidB-like acyl-CoA dehydrogenase